MLRDETLSGVYTETSLECTVMSAFPDAPMMTAPEFHCSLRLRDKANVSALAGKTAETHKKT